LELDWFARWSDVRPSRCSLPCNLEPYRRWIRSSASSIRNKRRNWLRRLQFSNSNMNRNSVDS
jgi:hypothetical protein